MPCRKSWSKIPSILARTDGGESASRLPCETSAARGANACKHFSAGMAGFKVKDPELHQPRPLVLADSRGVGLLDPRKDSRGSRKVRFDDGSSGSGQHRRRLLGGSECGALGEPSKRSPAINPNCWDRWAAGFLGHSKEVDSFADAKKSWATQRADREIRENRIRVLPSRNPRRSPRGARRQDQEGRRQCSGWERFTALNSDASLASQCKAGQEKVRIDSQPKVFHVPGSGASTFSGGAILQSLLRHLLKSRCRLGSFCRSFVTQQLACSMQGATACSELFPMPIPFPEALQKKNQFADGKSTMKKGAVAVVLALNFLHLGRPHDARGLEHVGRRLNRRQWKAVNHFEL